MKIAVKESEKGIGFVNPNPLVGAVIVKNNKMISKGYHEYYGGDHAEVNAIKNANYDLKNSTMYVTLEPCCHHGKTPPCTKAIISKGIKKVVIGIKDPNPIVSGKGIEILKKNKVEVELMNYEPVKKLNKFFIHRQKFKRPYILLKNAMTLDGKIATFSGDSKWISNEKSREYVHYLRHKYMGILIGINTVISDNPRLNVRHFKGKSKDPVPIILDSKLKITFESRIIKSKKLIIFTTKNCDFKKKDILESKGVKVIISPIEKNKVSLDFVVKNLNKMGFDSLIVEGGSKINGGFFDGNLVDEYMTFIAPVLIGGKKSISPIVSEERLNISNGITLSNMKIRSFDGNFMVSGKVNKEESICLQD